MENEMFSNRLREVRKSRGLTQTQMSKMLNISATAYGDYERGRTEPDLNTLRMISNVLQVSIDYLLEVKHEKKDLIMVSQSDWDTLTRIVDKYK